MSRRSGWLRGFRALGQASVELVGAELAALAEELKTSGKVLSRSLVLIVLGAFFLFWALGALTYTAIIVLALWLPRWASALIVLGALLGVAASLAGLGWYRIRRLETPAVTVRRRAAEHATWLRGQSLPAPGDGDEPAPPR